MHKHYVAFIMLFLVSDLWAQESERQLLKGKVIADAPELEGIYVINTKTEQSTVTERGGYFSIMAREGDSIMFSSVQFKAKVVGITKADFQKDLFFVGLETMVHHLDEVKIVRYKNINAVALGIIPKSAKKYTPAERRLKTAGDLKPQDFLAILGGGMQTDPIINAITGRTAMLKKEVEIEKKEFLIAVLEDMFDEKYLVDKLKIPELYVKGFRYYAIENHKFIAILKSNNKSMATFLLGELAVKYIEIIHCESE